MAGGNEAAHATCLATNYSPWFGFHLDIPASHLKQALENPDAVHVAAQLGRLDLVSGLVTSLGILVALAAVVGFWAIRTAAINAARKAAEAEVRELLPKILTPFCVDVLKDRPDLIGAALRHDPSILLSVMREAKETFLGDANKSKADTIAVAAGKDHVGN